MDKQKQAARNQKEDVVLNRTLIWFGGAVVVELLLLLLNRYYINYNVSGITLMSNIHKALPVMIAALAVLTVVCALWLYTGLKKKRSGLIPGLLTGVFGALALGCLAAFRFKGAGIQLMCTLVPAVAVLALVYYLYQREFFAITVLSALGLVGLWVFRKAGGGGLWLFRRGGGDTGGGGAVGPAAPAGGGNAQTRGKAYPGPGPRRQLRPVLC